MVYIDLLALCRESCVYYINPHNITFPDSYLCIISHKKSKNKLQLNSLQISAQSFDVSYGKLTSKGVCDSIADKGLLCNTSGLGCTYLLLTRCATHISMLWSNSKSIVVVCLF